MSIFKTSVKLSQFLQFTANEVHFESHFPKQTNKKINKTTKKNQQYTHKHKHKMTQTRTKKNPKAFLNVRLFLDDGLRVISYIHFPSFRCCQHFFLDTFRSTQKKNNKKFTKIKEIKI